jgi:hypothetical protein
MTHSHCGTCKFVEIVILDDGDGPALTCRRFPPTLFVLDGEVTQTLPQVTQDDWCGEYQWEPGAVTDR